MKRVMTSACGGSLVVLLCDRSRRKVGRIPCIPGGDVGDVLFEGNWADLLFYIIS